MSSVGDQLPDRACLGSPEDPPADPAGQQDCGCVVLPGRTMSRRWFGEGSSLGSRFCGLTGHSANRSTPLTVPRGFPVMLDQTVGLMSLAQSC